MATAAVAALAPILSALGNQKSSGAGRSRPQIESAIPAMAAADKKRLKILKKEAEAERLYNLLTQPEVLGLLITLGGMAASQYIPFSSDKGANEVLQATATSASVLMGLGHAGVGDLTTAIVALMAGGGSLLGGLGNLSGLGGGSWLSNSFLEGAVPGYRLLEQYIG